MSAGCSWTTPVSGWDHHDRKASRGGTTVVVLLRLYSSLQNVALTVPENTNTPVHASAHCTSPPPMMVGSIRPGKRFLLLLFTKEKLLFCSHSAYWLPTRKNYFTRTVANPTTRGLLNTIIKEKVIVRQRPPPTRCSLLIY